MARPRRLGTLLALLLLAGIALAAWVGWTAYRVNGSLNAVVNDAGAVQAAVGAGDSDAAQAALRELRESSRDAADRTSGPTWKALGVLPFVGDDADGVALAADVVADLGSKGVEPLIATADDLDSIVPRGGQVDLAALERLQQPVATADTAFTEADSRLAGADPDGFVDRLAIEFRDLREKVAEAQEAMSAAATALEIMPSMLGAEGPRDYLLVMQNNAEVRATGGLPGAISVVRAEEGRIGLTRQVAGNAFGQREKPVLPLTDEERDLFSTNLGLYVLDANLTPDWPRASELIGARWTETQPEDPAGVLSIDPVALSYLLEVTGPVQVGGVELTAENAVDELLHEVYVRLPEPAAQDAFFRIAAKTVFDRVSSGVEQPQEMLRALTRAAREGRLLVHSFGDEQEVLAGTAVSGELPTKETERPQVGVYLDDTSVGKMSYFLRHDVRGAATSCSSGRQRLDGMLRLESVADPAAVESLPDYVTGGGRFGAPVGSQFVVAYLYGPVGGSIDKVRFNGSPVAADGLEHEGRPVARVIAELAPGEVANVEWKMTTPEGQTGRIDVRTTPSIEPTRSSATYASACG
ncbi:DUF4012 domain-containing protein [Nocardioides deserti]|uniref:DUF4012 domain-containing protein n=1 Tax=Nocardioides deserti TaxID=1588644 RepID=A0ABR6UCV1_9ACTN|nr:DUF4012 domain-containing protein [Nocardioides deserti]MBC2962287.1 DUF4012 domain-containing protein [Nocardioides deserti]GGO79067.1 hypothetical protein GCM10012276_37950 [Nocardioides deserti]